MFAAQVVAVHTGDHLGASLPGIVQHFPGVPAFFFISGFLVYGSYAQNNGADYWRNRSLRLLPALIFATLGGVVVALLAHGWRDLFEYPGTYVTWILAQITLGQAYNPSHFRYIGVGVINGSLWTLTTEILFYVLVPIITWVEHRFRMIVPSLMAMSFAIYTFGPDLLDFEVVLGKTLFEFLALTPLIWGWMFGFGILAFKHFDRLPIRWLPLAGIPMALMIWQGDGALFHSAENRLGIFYFCAYAAIVLWLSFGIRAPKLLPDFSYGAYIWHMPIINLLLVFAIPNAAPVAIGLTLLFAVASWYMVEKPALRLKTYPAPS